MSFIFSPSLLYHILASPIKLLKERRKCLLWKLCFWMTIVYNSLPVCKLYMLGYKIFSKLTFDAFPSRDLYFTKQIVYNCAPLLSNRYPGGMLLALRFDHIYSNMCRSQWNLIVANIIQWSLNGKGSYFSSLWDIKEKDTMGCVNDSHI